MWIVCGSRSRSTPSGWMTINRAPRFDVGVVEATAVADPALVDVVVLARGHAHKLATALPEVDVAPDRALRADALGVGHVPRARLEPPDARGQCADGAEVDDVAAEVRLERLVELARDERLHASLSHRELLLPRHFVVVARTSIAEDAALAIQRDVFGQRYRLLEMQPRAVDAARG